MTVHGGDVWDQEIPASDILDFSANVNPSGLPHSARERLISDAANSQLLRLYPDPSARSLRRALAQFLGCEAESIVVGPGAESLMAPILRYLGAKSALIPVPAFSEYRRVCAQENVRFIPFQLSRSEQFRLSAPRYLESITASQCDLVLINNPHNPTGSLLSRDEVRAISEAGVVTIVDEAFIDYAAEASLVREAAAKPGLIVIRSLTKFFGCPALRVGYAVAHPDTIQVIRELLPTWPVTQMAMDALAEAVADKDYAEVSLRQNETERNRLSDLLKATGLEVFPSAANYLFIELAAGMRAASKLRSSLMSRHKILIRNCDSYEGLKTGRYVRVAVRSREDNDRLIQALGEELPLK